MLDSSKIKKQHGCYSIVNLTIYQVSSTVETRIKEPTFLGDSLLKYLIFCFYNPYMMDWGSASSIQTCKDCIFITVAFSPIVYFLFKAIFVNMLY